MFDEADPILARLHMLVLAFPDGAEEISHGWGRLLHHQCLRVDQGWT
jgi:hypothetical protein